MSSTPEDTEKEQKLAELRALNAERAKAGTAWKSFLESTPPNTGIKIPGIAVSARYQNGSTYRHLPKVRLQLHCDVDGGIRWFDCKRAEVVIREPWEYEFIGYTCRDCGRFSKTYAGTDRSKRR